MRRSEMKRGQVTGLIYLAGHEDIVTGLFDYAGTSRQRNVAPSP